MLVMPNNSYCACVRSVAAALLAALSKMSWQTATRACTLAVVPTLALVMPAVFNALLSMSAVGWPAPPMPVTPMSV